LLWYVPKYFQKDKNQNKTNKNFHLTSKQNTMSSSTLPTQHEHPQGDPPSYPSSLHAIDPWIPPPIEEDPYKRRICHQQKYIFAFIGLGVIAMALILGVVFATLKKHSKIGT
jgi:hypothetical protein